jgi:hypothetical protein
MGKPNVFRAIRWPESGADHAFPCKFDTVNGLELYFNLPSVPCTGMSWGDLYIYPLLLYKYSRYNFEVSHGRAVCSVTRNIKKMFRIKSVNFVDYIYTIYIFLTLCIAS